MAKLTDVNNGGAAGYDYADAIYDFKQLLVSAGWVVKSSSDGTTYNAAGDQISHGGAGANGMDNTRAWFRIQDPAGLREFTIQNASTGSTNWRVKYSAVDRFTGGSPGATQTPSATDEAVLLGGGTDAAPTFATWFGNTLTNCYYHAVAYSDALNGVYAFYSFSATKTSGALAHGFVCEPLATASYPSVDVDPCVLSVGSAGFGVWKGWHAMNISGKEEFVPWETGSYYRGSYAFYPGSAGTNPYDGDENGIPELIGRSYYTDNGHLITTKGFTGRMLLKGSSKIYPNTCNLATDAKVFAGNYILPWENGTTPSI